MSRTRYIVEVIDAGYVHTKEYGSYFVYTVKDGFITTNIEEARVFFKEKLDEAEKEGWNCKSNRFEDHYICKRKDKPEWIRTIRIFTPDYIEDLKNDTDLIKNK